jgi:hypothetical protein
MNPLAIDGRQLAAMGCPVTIEASGALAAPA